MYRGWHQSFLGNVVNNVEDTEAPSIGAGRRRSPATSAHSASLPPG
jgi:hypothetical protein